MSIYNIRELFVCTIATSSIDYVRNYNFNSATVTDIPIFMFNSGSEIPITVNITTTEPWMQIVDGQSGANLKYPSGNVVLGPTSSKEVLLKIDLPPEIESIPESVIRPEVLFEILSGSFPIVQEDGSGNSSDENNDTDTGQSNPRSDRIKASTYAVTLFVGEKSSIALTILDKKKVPIFSRAINNQLQNTITLALLKRDLSVTSDDISIATVSTPKSKVPSYSPIVITGKLPGETKVRVKYDKEETVIVVTVVEQETSDQSDGTTNGTVNQSSRTVVDESAQSNIE
jgi:hypothetical protein